ncbi:MAG TPA: hypothetical protein VF199_11100 [Bacillales bacterium]
MKNRFQFKELLLWLLVINVGIEVGAGLYEQRVVISQLFGTSPETWINTGKMFWVYVTTIPLTLLIVANGVVAWKTRGPRRPWYLLAIAILIVERGMTFSYFIPEMAGLIGNESLSQAEVDSALSLWFNIDYIRHVFSISGWLLAMKTLTIPKNLEDKEV